MFAITLITFVNFFLLFSTLFISLSDQTECNLEITSNCLTLQNENRYLKFKYNIGFEYFAFFNIYLPTLYSIFSTENSSITLAYNLFKFFDIPSMDFISDLFYEDNPQSSTVEYSPKNSALCSSNSGNDILSEFTSTTLFAFELVAILVAFAGLISIAPNDAIEWILFFGSVGIFLSSLVLLIKTTLEKGGTEDLFWIGLGVGSMISLLITAVIAGIVGSLDFKDKKALYVIVGISTIIITICNLIYTITKVLTKFLNLDADNPKSIMHGIEDEIGFSLLTLISGSVLIGFYNNEDINRHIILFASFGIGLFMFFAVIALWDLVQKYSM